MWGGLMWGGLLWWSHVGWSHVVVSCGVVSCGGHMWCHMLWSHVVVTCSGGRKCSEVTLCLSNIGHVTSSAGLTNGDSDSEAVPVAAPLTNSFPPQYSPSISHDEVEGLGTASELIRQVKGESSEGESSEGESSEGESSGEEWEEFEDKTWHSIEREKQEKQVSSTSKKTSKLILKPTKSQERPSGKVDNLKESMKGRLSAEDIERLEIQSSWAKSEPDLFADMAPKISRGISYPNGSGTTVGDTPTLTGVSLTDALQYQPKHVVSNVQWNPYSSHLWTN